MDSLKAMWRLQNTEVEMVKLRKEWNDIKELLGRESGAETAEIQAGIAEARARWQKNKEEYEESTLEIETIGRKLEQFNSQLYDGGGLSKELVSLQQNIDQLEKRRHLLEEKQLGCIEELDDLEKRIANETVRFQRLDEQRKSRLSRLGERREEIKGKYGLLKERREELRADIPEDMMALYTDLVGQKKRPMATLVGENCSGCGIAQTTQNVNALKKEGRYTRCINCGRIIVTGDYLEE